MNREDTFKATILTMMVFTLQPLAVGGWLALIPLIKEQLDLSKGELAFALLGMPVALVPTLQIAGRIISGLGPRRIMAVVFPIQSVAVMLPLLAWNGPSLFVALAVLGAAVAFIEVAFNVYAGRLEKRAGLMIMNRCHGCWALGLMLGSAWVTAVSGLSPWLALGALSVLAGIVGCWAALSMPRIGDGDESGQSLPRRTFNQLPPALIFVALFMFFVTMTEGAMADWSAVYLAERLGDGAERAGIAVTIFTAFMAGGRFLGDWFKRHLGSVALARLTVGCAVVGLFLLVLPLPLPMAILGFALVGFGVSTAYPLGVSAVAALDDKYEAPNIAIMATVALGGFLVGPPVIGTLAELTNLQIGLAALLPGLILALWLTRWLRPRDSD